MTTSLSFPEELQLALDETNGRVRMGYWQLATAAVLELALLERFSVAALGRFSQPSGLKITLVDATPTGHPPLDVVITAFSARRNAEWGTYKSITGVAKSVTEATVSSLNTRGIATGHGKPGGPGSYLEIHDETVRRAAADHLRSRPADPLVSDLRVQVLMDIWRRSDVNWSPEPGLDRPRISAEYPAGVRPIADAALDALFTLNGTAI